MIHGLAKEVARRMEHVRCKGRKLTLKVKQRKKDAPPPPKFLGHGSCNNISRAVTVPGTEYTSDVEIISRLCLKLFDELDVPTQEVRGMGITVSMLDLGAANRASKPGIRDWLDHKTRGDAFAGPANSSEEPRVWGNTTPIEKRGESNAPGLGLISEQTYYRLGERDTEDLDFQLPPLSQIHMSQVELLPSPMKRRVVRAMEQKAKMVTTKPKAMMLTAAEVPTISEGGRMRMRRLTEVRSGNGKLFTESGEPVSLTQLAELPLDIQLQLANGDFRRGDSSSGTSRELTWNDSGRILATKAVEELVHDSFVDVDPMIFYNENISPLMDYMNSNSGAGADAVSLVLRFLRLFFLDHGLLATLRLVRAVRRRHDVWGNEILPKTLIPSINEEVARNHSAFIDWEDI
jgi:impB/mucB/samB family C-terminal domain